MQKRAEGTLILYKRSCKVSRKSYLTVKTHVYTEAAITDDEDNRLIGLDVQL